MSHDDDYLDYQNEQALDELFREHTQEFKKELAHEALIQANEPVMRVRGVLDEALRVLPISPTAAFLLAAIGCEIVIRDLLFIPILSGLIHEKLAVAIVVKSFRRMNRDELDSPLTTLLKQLTFINLEETKRRPENKPILVEARTIAKTRNAISHNGDFANEADAKKAIAVASYLLNDTFQKLLWLNGLYLVPEDKILRFVPEEGPQIIVSLARAPSEVQQEPP